MPVWTPGVPWVAIQRNPTSGAGSSRRKLMELYKALKELGLRPRIYTSRERLNRVLEDPQRRRDVRCIVAAGGDGTCLDVFNRFPEIPLAIFPLGTENLLARYCGFRPDGKQVAQVIQRNEVRSLDIGLVGSRRFVSVASVGFDAAIIHQVHHGRRGHIHRMTYVPPILHQLRTYEYPELRVWLDDAPTPLLAREVMIVNLPRYALGLQIARDACDDDGWLNVRLFHRGSAWNMIRYFIHILLGNYERLSDVSLHRARRIRIESDRPAPLQMDGDPAGNTPVEVTVQPTALRVLWPAKMAR